MWIKENDKNIWIEEEYDTCNTCGRKLTGIQLSRKGKFCSRTCSNIYKQGRELKEKFCLICGKKLIGRRKYYYKACSKKCGYILRSRERPKPKAEDLDTEYELKGFYVE